MNKKDIIGRLGEDIACRFLVTKKYRIVQRNYRKKWGEIDIIAESDTNTHFFEVKSVSYRPNLLSNNIKLADEYLPEENIHSFKIKRLLKTINSYFMENHRHNHDNSWQLNAIIVHIDKESKKAHIKVIENIATR